jgi:hypothetical protein
MTTRARKVIEAALALPKEELLLVVAELQESVESSDSPEEIDAAWRDEHVRRFRSTRGGSALFTTATTSIASCPRFSKKVECSRSACCVRLDASCSTLLFGEA